MKTHFQLLRPFILLAAWGGVGCGDSSSPVQQGSGGAAGTQRDAAGSGGSLVTQTGGRASGGIPGAGGSPLGGGGAITASGGSVGAGGSGGSVPTGGSGSGGLTTTTTTPLDSGLDSAIDAPSPDAPLAPIDSNDGSPALDGDFCKVPNVWRYQQPGCGADAHPVCGSAMGDACLRYACGCNGEILGGCDYYRKPWRSAGLCPDLCFGPAQNLSVVSQVKGCACNPSTDAPQCVQYIGLFSCVGGAWTVDYTKNCTTLDGGIDGQVASDCSVATAQRTMADLGLVETGPATTLEATLPSPISGPDWGLKATVCQDGGYDITSLAGATVCLVKQPIKPTCTQAPSLAWVVMSGGAVKCIYETNDATPGVYSVNGYTCP